MSISRKRILTMIIGVILLFGITCAVTFTLLLTGSKVTVHSISPGESFNDNPLKGFVSYSNSYADFPHSMEWFYIPMSALYPDQNSSSDTKPDFAALEKELNVIAERGNQAIFRIYIDYPSNDPDLRPVGIPKFLRKEPYNLITHDYGNFQNYISQIPDYSNVYLRKTIQNCIAALGEKYDGDNRIAFITGGFLGFWGEWHCWPFNGKNDILNYEPTMEVINEVIVAYEKAFKKTRILFRYPKGENVNKTQFGYHDDSYCYETAPVSLGGEAYNFGELLKLSSPSVEERWKTAPIGGELRPEIQKTIFEKEPWTAAPDKPKEKWEDNRKAIHPTWLLNEAIKQYKGGTKDAAIKAANQMGYDFRVITAGFKDNLKSNEKIYLSVDIQNIGIAPFYYDHGMWPVKIGVKQDNKLIKSWTTPWNLDKIAADGNTVRFEYTVPEKNGFKNGYCNICIKVENPLPNGNPLGFANEYQYDDGWLDLGLFSVGKVDDMPKPQTAPKPIHKQKEPPKSVTEAAADPNTYEAEAEGNTLEGGAKADSGATYSGGMKIGYIGNNSGTLQFNNIKAPKDGEFTLCIYYATEEARSVSISVNGGAAINVDFEPGPNWTKVLQKDVPVKLKEGDNTIKLFNEAGWAPDIDKISIRDASQ